MKVHLHDRQFNNRYKKLAGGDKSYFQEESYKAETLEQQPDLSEKNWCYQPVTISEFF
jgi:hypothetical protein